MSRERTSLSPTPYGVHLGIEIVEAVDGVASLRLPLAEHICNRRGVAHGGAVASLLDSALGAAVISVIAPEEWCGTLQLSIQYKRSGASRSSGRRRSCRTARSPCCLRRR